MDAGGLNPSEADEDYLRTKLDLPDRVEDDSDDDKTTTKRSKSTSETEQEADDEVEQQDEVKAARVLAYARETKAELEQLIYGRSALAA